MVKNRLREYLKKSPNGYYILIVNQTELSNLGKMNNLIIEEIGMNQVMIKTKSRRVFVKVLRKLGRI